MKIITVTLNPAYDFHYQMNELVLYKENYVDHINFSVGGKGINISRALKKNGLENFAYVMLGKENKFELEERLRIEEIGYHAIYCKGRIRENITVHTPGKPETRISLDNFTLDETKLLELEMELLQVIDQDTIVAFSGRIPKGLSREGVIEFLLKLKHTGCYLAVDSSSLTMEDLLEVKPWLIKPNEQEIETLLKKPIKTIEEAKETAEWLHQQGIDMVLISMGPQGACLVTEDSYYIASTPDIQVKSTIGAGDSMIAGFIGAYAQHENLKECLLQGVAYGTAACMVEGTAPPEPEMIKELQDKILIQG